MNVNANKDILMHLMNIEDQLAKLNSKIDNFLGFDELTFKELKELDEIEENMAKGKKISLNDII
jgi:TolA-binding protein